MQSKTDFLKNKFKAISPLILVASLSVFSIVIANTISQYIGFKTDVGFLKFKQEVITNKYWKLFFYIHIFSILFCLITGITQFSSWFLKEFKSVHRLIGRMYVYNVLLVNVPACFILGLFANGGVLGITGFLIQDFLWLYFTLMAFLSIKNKRIEAHKKFMVLSYAITTTAITFRIFKNLFYNESIFSYSLFYGITVWASLFFNLAIALLILKKKSTLDHQVG